MTSDQRDADGDIGLHQLADEAFAYGRVRYPCNFLFAHPHRDELLQPPVFIQDAHRSVARGDLKASEGGDALHQRFGRDIADQLQTGEMQRSQAVFELFAGQGTGIHTTYFTLK